MGAKISKIDQGINEDELVEGNLPSTPVHTPKTRIIEVDPRSPSANIVRTPIQVTNGFIKNGSPAIGVINSSDFLDYSIKEYPTINLDPRSPTVEFTRTPIVVDKLPTKLHNKNLDNVRKQIADLSPFKKSNKSEKIIGEIGKDDDAEKSIQKPILLESSPIKRKYEPKEKRNSFVGLLETNLDYVETNLDTVFKKCGTQLNNVDLKENSIKETEDEEKIENMLPVSEIIIETPIEKLQTNETNPKNIFSPVNDEKIEQDTCENELDHEKELQHASEKLEKQKIIEKTLQKINQIDQETKDIIAITQEPVIIVETPNPTNDFDQKLTNLIYQDDECKDFVTPIKQQRPKENNRTPLSIRNDNVIKTKSINKLKVHDKSTKVDYAVSKIPVFKDKKGKKGNIQCENTPPCKIPELKSMRKSQWDADNTLII